MDLERLYQGTATGWMDPRWDVFEQRASSRSSRHGDETARPCGSALRVLLCGGAAAFQCPGGGEVQLVKTAEYLRRLGVRAKLFNPWRDKLRDADCLHLFGTLREHLPLVAAARAARTPAVLSTIAWYDLRACWHLARSGTQRVYHAGRFLLRAAAPWAPSWRRRLYGEVDLLLPNSEAEARQLRRYFRMPTSKIHVVPNGAALPEIRGQRSESSDGRTAFRRWGSGISAQEPIASPSRRLGPAAPHLAPGDHRGLFSAIFAVRDYVLCPGRIEPRKNQLALLKALSDLDRPVVILGDAVPEHGAYASECRRAAGTNVHFVAAVPPGSALLASAYRSAACVVLPGWFETPGLAALEAALAEVPLVVTQVGSAREYFGRRARYVDPRRPATIAAAVRDALGNRVAERPRCKQLAARVAQRYSWTLVAAACRDAYEKVVS